MKIGHAHFDLTPKGEFYLIGFRSENRMYPASGVHDPIFGNALLLDDGEQELYIFSADFLEFEESMAEDVKNLLAEKYGIARDNVLLCATHDHNSVVSYHKSWYTGKFDAQYYAFLLDTICRGVEVCRANAQPASAKIGSRVILGYYGNRNHPGQPADNEVFVLHFCGDDGKPFAGLVNWAVHSTVLGGENTWLTAEWAGNVSKKLESSFGYYPAMIVGAAGDCSNRNERHGKDFAELERVSEGMANEIAAIPADKPLRLDKIRCQTLYHTIHTPDFHLDAKGQVFDLGDVQLFVFPGELGSAFGPALRSSSGKCALVFGYTNGYYEYFLPASEYGLSFETQNCKVPRGEPEKMIRKYQQAARLLASDEE